MSDRVNQTTGTVGSTGSQTLYASFADAAMAEKAAGALMDYGSEAEDISLVANDAYGHTRSTTGEALDSTSTTAHRAAGSAANVGDAGVDATKSVGNRVSQAGDRTAATVAGAVGATGAAANYDAAADERAARAETRADMARNEDVVHDRAGVSTATAAPGGVIVDRSTDDRVDSDRLESSAKAGISTTTPADAGAGAAKGAGVGLALGAIGGALSLLIPGIGWVVGGGALATAIGAALGTAAGGAVAGGVMGYLKDQGMADAPARAYAGAVENGGALLAIRLPSGKVDATTAQDILAKYGAQNPNVY